ncbi:unnamed protein product [Owenia fusiformis]|uniref:Uncharacterized protein n=1 Tax=Owenia fusiformis TaxID=6347 RepID=A0A8J1UH62_OWEFU|nr:unnamed protein product [Owenia fusiformis]
MAPPLSPQETVGQIQTFKSYVALIADPTTGVEKKLKAAQELSENFETVTSSPQYQQFLQDAMRVFLKILQDGEPQFVAEQNNQQLRKLLLEILHRIPTNEHLRPYVKQILPIMFGLLEKENEENVLVALRIIMELHKQYRPQMNQEIQKFLHFVKTIYKELPNHLAKIFEPRAQVKVKEMSEVNVETMLAETFTMTTIMTDKKNSDGQQVSCNIIPRAVLSLKVLAELPIIVVLMYQLYKQSVHSDVADFIPLIMNTIILQPSPQHRGNPAFNKEVFVDFIAAQIKTLSFLAYIIRMYQEIVNTHSQQMVRGMLQLFTLCPLEVAHLRKELLIAARHILATDLRNRFVPHIDKLFDENILIGSGWTTHESLRPLAYSTLADLVHHVRQSLPLNELSMAVNLFSKNVHDETLPSNIQTMSCKLLLNLVECIGQRSEQETGNGRELLMRMLVVFVMKFKTIAELQLPAIMSKCRPTNDSTSKTPTPPPTIEIKKEPDVKDDKPGTTVTDSKDEKEKTGKGANYSVSDCRSLVKTLVCGVKTITWGTASCKAPGTDATFTQNKQFLPKETLVFVRLVKHALKALDIYTVNMTAAGQAYIRPANVQTVRMKEEKEVLEHFAGVFTLMNPNTFREIFSTTVEYMVERIHHNYALQIVANSFLANPTTSATFATILVEYLLKRLEEMGSNMERSNLYLKLFKLVFGSVSILAAVNEQMLKPHLHTIVNKSMELAMTAKEPYNYFLLLRSLFRSIGGGSHDLLYQEFLPLLPNLLQGLNSLQSGLHKQHMKDLFVELCLTVPVRLSSLLPYLPMLMDPLVSALNGSQTLVSQGLRTLELCVDNLQPDFLYDHIQPVRAELMQALWRTLRNPHDQIAHVAFRVLGKFGGGNRKMLREPQSLTYNERETVGPCITVYFQDVKTPISLPVEKSIEVALGALKSSSTEAFYRKQAWDMIRCYLVSMMNLEDDKQALTQLFTHPSFTEKDVPIPHIPLYRTTDGHARIVQEQALTGMFVAAAIKDLRPAVLPFMASIVRHYTMVTIPQQCGPFPISGEKQTKLQGMDPQVLIDALSVIMGHEEKELCKPGHLALVLILDTATTILGSKERACQLPIFDYLVEKMCSLCYDRAWYAKLGGCIAIKFMFERMSRCWVFDHQFLFLKAFLFVMMDLTNEVSSGALDMAKSNLEQMLTMCAKPIPAEESTEELLSTQSKSVFDVTHELVRQVTSPNTLVREQSMYALKVLSKTMDKTITDIMEPHKDVLQDMIPPKKHLLRHQPANAQIGLMDGNTFCTTLEPRLFTIDLNIVKHKVFFTELLNLCEAEDQILLKLPCYKSVTNLVPLRTSAMKALAACHYNSQYREKIFSVLYKTLNSTNSDLQEAAFECMKKFIAGIQIDMEQVHLAMRPLLLQLGDYRSLNLNVIQRLTYLTQLFPNTFNEKLCEQLLAHLKKWMDVAVIAQKGGQARNNGQVISNEMKTCAAIINIFHLIPAASQKMLEPLTTLSLKGEKALLIEAGSPFQEPLMKFLLRYPSETVELFLSEANITVPEYNRCFQTLLKKEDGKIFRDSLQANPQRLITMAFGQLTPPSDPATQPLNPATNKIDLQYQAICYVNILASFDVDWLSKNSKLVANLLKIWISEAFHSRHKKIDAVDFEHWKEPRLLVECLLSYFKLHTNEIELMFQILRCFSFRYIPQFHFVSDFLEDVIAQTYTVDWKRKAFFKFVDIFHEPKWPQDLKAKVLQYILIPCFTVSFEKNEGEKLIGGPPVPDQDNSENIISVFINKIIDPDNPFGTSDAVRILLLQFSSLLVSQASPHIHDAANKKHGNKLRRLMTFAWPCLLPKNCVDPATKYHGHLLLSHIIAKFAIHKRIVLQVFHSLLKAHALEARSVVKQALDILTPAMPGRMEDGNMLTHWTKKIIVEEGHTVAQLLHILQLLVRHYKVYYPVRHHLIQHMVGSIQRLGFTPSATMEHRKLAVDQAEVIIKWEVQRVKEEAEGSSDPAVLETSGASASIKRTASVDSPQEAKRIRHSSEASAKSSGGGTDVTKPIDKQYCDAVVNFLLRIACQVNEASTTIGSPGEILSRRCVTLLKTALKSDVWPNAELKLGWFDKLLMSVETHQPNFANICTALELLRFLLDILKTDVILPSFKPLQRGIAACMTCPNSKVIRAVHSLLSRLMSIFPTEAATSNVASKYEELECLYACVSKVVYEGLANYEKSNNGSPSQLFGTLMILKAACMHNLSYIDRLIGTFMRVLQRMAREHLTPSSAETSPVASELLILSLDLVKNRVGRMTMDMRKGFIGTILVGLIDKTPDAKVMKAITRMVEDWVKIKTPLAISQSPSPREKAILLDKLMKHVEKRFPDDTDLHAHFLELVNYIYRDETLAGSELTSKLEPAFLAGLRSSQPSIRHKFFEVFENSIRRRLYDRTLYITCSQNWEAMLGHYWIKQCIQLLLGCAVTGCSIQSASSLCLLPSCKSVVSLADSHDRAAFAMVANLKEEPMDVETIEQQKEEDEIDIELSEESSDATSLSKEVVVKKDQVDNKQGLQLLIQRQAKFLEQCRDVKTISFLSALSQICHSSVPLSNSIWVHLFPRIWQIFTEKQQQGLAGELVPFLCSGSHAIQKDCHPSSAHTFVEGIALCHPPIPIRPPVLKYLGRTHNLWHRACLMLEQSAIENGLGTLSKPKPGSEYEFEPVQSPQQETLDALCDLYALLKEEDMAAGLWLKRAKYTETNTALAYEQHGFFEQAQTNLEAAMSKARAEHNSGPASPSIMPEYKLWENHWIKCCKELNQWDLLLDYANAKGNTNPHLVLESAWRVPNWGLMKEALAQVELSCPKEMTWRVNLYRGYIAICHPEDHHLNMIEKRVELSSNLAIKEWRRLPSIVSHIHVPLLQAAQQIMELQEAAQINQGLQPANIGRQSSLHDMKAIVKTWRNRLPMISDDLSHWSDIFTWRQHHYQFIVNHYDSHSQHDPNTNHSMLGVHASAQAIIHYGKIARKHHLTGVCLDSLSRIHTIPSVPIVDCFQKIRQQVKCYLQMSGVFGKNELQEGLEVIESTNLKYFTKEMTAEFYALKGMFLAQIGRSEDANKAFSAAVQMHDVLVKAWALWGDYLESIFVHEKSIHLGVSAITCYLHACRHQNESKSRKYLAKVLWLLTYDNEESTLAEAVDKYCIGVPPIQWLPWIPQLLTCLVRNEGRLILNLLSQVGRMYPQAVYFPIRTLYLTLKIEQRERYLSDKSGELAATRSSSPTPPTSSATPGPTETATDMVGVESVTGPPPTPSSATPTSTPATLDLGQSSASASMSGSNMPGQSMAGTSETGPIKATAPMWRCSRIMHMQRDLHPTILSSLEGIVDQMVWFRENWYEEVLRQLRQGLTKCCAVAFENRGAVTEATITPHTLNFVKKLVSTFGVGIENVSSVTTTFSSAASESLARRAQATAQDPVFQRMKSQFTTDFDFSVAGSTRLHNLINKLKKWIKILEAKTKLLPKWFLIEEKCRFLSNFSLSTAEVELPGEFLLPKHSHYYVKIARFMPRVEIVQKHNTAARRLYIRGHNGNIYPYLVVNDACLTESRREERVLQLLRMANLFLGKQKETCRRLLHFTVPRVIAVSPQMRLVEDNPASVSLLDVYKQRCMKRDIEHDAPIARYYERLATVQARGSQASHQVLRDILKEFQTNMVPRGLMKEWACHAFPNATDYWTFRKTFTIQLALSGFAEFVLHLSRMNPDMMYLHQDCGYLNVAYFKFDIDDQSGELDANRPVPFRLTPNIADFLTSTGVSGPLTASMISAARCLVQPQYKLTSLLRAILRDEYITWHKKKHDETNPGSQPVDMEGETLIAMVNKAVSAISTRLQNLATFDGAESRVSTLVAAANSHDNLCRMDPAWHPWL